MTKTKRPTKDIFSKHSKTLFNFFLIVSKKIYILNKQDKNKMAKKELFQHLEVAPILLLNRESPRVLDRGFVDFSKPYEK